MEETSTTIVNDTFNEKAMNGSDANENLDAEDLIFYHSLRTNLEQLKMNPSSKTIHKILDYSKNHI